MLSRDATHRVTREARANSGVGREIPWPRSAGIAFGIEGGDGVGQQRLLGFTEAEVRQPAAEASEARGESFFVPATPARPAALLPLALRIGCWHGTLSLVR